ncbi:LuxR C-terminal-related transcriptional regulator [Paramicrobacterium fandaimingii]|uniref:LuxR C-terminal-related transcriptional regulator n=1 Tax=Paramicrobacterium fandaimingii TaxID=2708079 RepID=UPI00141ECE8D|nr:LuxR C-terminal-related transcriptional regulator [Microbacterium fandaimingii]
MTDTAARELALTAFHAQSWSAACAHFDEADRTEDLGPDDLECYAQALSLVGRDDACVRVLDRSYHSRLDDGDREQAAECAFWLAFNQMNRGQMASAGGWLGRAGELLGDGADDAPLRGLLLIPAALNALLTGDSDAARLLFEKAQRIGRISGHPELRALSGLGLGQAMIAMGKSAEGMAQLDAVMVAITAGEVSPIVSGLVYCAVIIACHDTYDVGRAAEWTGELTRWCASQPDLVVFRGECLVHRAQILVLNGKWTEATEQVQRASECFGALVDQVGIGMAYYEAAELHRLRGEFAAAENSYRRASQSGHETQPGLALLRLAQGRVETAMSGIRRALDERGKPGDRPRHLAACVEIALAHADVVLARTAASELADIAAASTARLLDAMSAQAWGEVLLAEERPRDALDELRRADDVWRSLGAPYQRARVRALQGRCCQDLGDMDAAEMELDAAADVFRLLGARPDMLALRSLRGIDAETGPGGLTPREVEVLRAVATGCTNRAIAEQFVLSEKTVARHLSNIFSKLEISSRSAATAYAYENRLMNR